MDILLYFLAIEGAVPGVVVHMYTISLAIKVQHL